MEKKKLTIFKSANVHCTFQDTSAMDIYASGCLIFYSEVFLCRLRLWKILLHHFPAVVDILTFADGEQNASSNWNFSTSIIIVQDRNVGNFRVPRW